MRSDGRLGRAVGGFLVVVHMEISAKKEPPMRRLWKLSKKKLLDY
jgi:hypothetical protein